MDFTENKFEISVGALVVLLMAGLFHLFGSMHGHAQTDGDIVYEMPRPKSFQGSDFDLSDREISRNYINPFVKKTAPTAANPNGKPAQIGAKTAAKAAAATKTADAKKKAEVTARTVAKSAEAGLSGGSTPESSPFAPNSGGRNTAAVESGTTATDKTDDTMSPDQWRALLEGQPTKANMDKLIDARNKGQVDSGTYNTIVGELLVNSNASIQDVGLYGAQTFPDGASFVVVAESKEHMSSTEQTKAETFLETYTQTSRLSGLSTALTSGDDTVVSLATQILIAGYQKAKTGTGTTDSRNGRGGVTTSSTSSTTAYQQFITVYQQLAKSSDTSIASLANSALSALSALAQNTTV